MHSPSQPVPHWSQSTHLVILLTTQSHSHCQFLDIIQHTHPNLQLSSNNNNDNNNNLSIYIYIILTSTQKRITWLLPHTHIDESGSHYHGINNNSFYLSTHTWFIFPLTGGSQDKVFRAFRVKVDFTLPSHRERIHRRGFPDPLLHPFFVVVYKSAGNRVAVFLQSPPQGYDNDINNRIIVIRRIT